MKPIGLLLHETSTLMKRRFEAAVRPENLTLAQWRFLGLLGREEAPMRQVAIAEALNAAPMTVSDLADRLEQMGLIERQPSPVDSRAKEVLLTEAGQVKYQEMKALAAAVFADVFEGIPQADLDQLQSTLTRILDNLGGK